MSPTRSTATRNGRRSAAPSSTIGESVVTDESVATGESVAARRGTAKDRAVNGASVDHAGYRVPLVGVSLSNRVVETSFWGTLLGAIAVGALDPPVALLVGAGVLVARHTRS